MRIGIDATFLQQTHGGGKEQVLFNLLKGFQALGKAYNIHIFAYYYSEDLLRDLIPDAAFTFLPYKNTFRKKTINDSLFKTFQLGKLVEQNHIDILFFPHYNTGFKKFKIPTVVLPHDIQVKTRASQFSLKDRILYGTFYYWDFKLRSRIISISDFDRREIEKYYPRHQTKIKQIYNPIDTEFSVPANEPTPGTPYICAVNIAFTHKNTITLIKAFEKIMDRIEHNLVLIGSTTRETSFLHDYVRERRLEERVIFTGFLKAQELNQVLRQASLYVNPSFYEGFGMTAIEAALLCIPVLSSMTGATPEVTRYLLNYYEPAEDESILAQKILEILLHEEYQSPERLAAIRREFWDSYNYIHISKLYYEFFEELVK